ncbi:MAG: response regulator transcription factor [Candidatus Nitrospinota bacterium M3_3B_026]
MRALVVEDDEALRLDLAKNLGAAGFAVDTTGNGEDAERMGFEEPYNVIVLDLGLPEKSGLQALSAWREEGLKTPVIILTARGAWSEKVDGLKAGADDYMAKPFHMEELQARISALIRRAHGKTTGGVIKACGFELDEDGKRAILKSGPPVSLTDLEFRVLRLFMLNPGRVLSKTYLEERVYDLGSEKDSNVIEVYIKRLRKKLGERSIKTRRGQGYVFGEED